MKDRTDNKYRQNKKEIAYMVVSIIQVNCIKILIKIKKDNEQNADCQKNK
ncbi:hypothetical protein [Flavobacterium sp. ov086]|nr:hypothetical protein [Flavobacterium sp. ov086]SNS03892.1 hypothetical protein SAMN04487979_1514 [Flavobacterium sp. ov086]